MTRLTTRTGAALLAAAALAAAAACGKGPRQPEPLRVNAKSGASVGVSRTTWEVCREATPTAGQSQRRRIVHGENGVVTYTFQTFDAPGCTGTAGSLRSVGFVGFDEGDRAVGWSGTPPAGAPESPLATKLSLSLDGRFIDALDCSWLDDQASPRLLYVGEDGSSTDAQGFPDLLSSGGYAEVR